MIETEKKLKEKMKKEIAKAKSKVTQLQEELATEKKLKEEMKALLATANQRVSEQLRVLRDTEERTPLDYKALLATEKKLTEELKAELATAPRIEVVQAAIKKKLKAELKDLMKHDHCFAIVEATREKIRQLESEAQ